MLLKNSYLKRHNQVLKCLFNEMLVKYKFSDTCSPWFTKSDIKPYYENKVACIWWDIPDFCQANTDEEDKVYRPGGKLKLIADKRIYIIEITISWINNREERYKEKSKKYESIIRNIKRVEPNYEVE